MGEMALSLRIALFSRIPASLGYHRPHPILPRQVPAHRVNRGHGAGRVSGHHRFGMQ